MKRSKEFHSLNFASKRLLEFAEKYPDGIYPSTLDPFDTSRADFLVDAGWLEKKYIGCRGDKVRYVRTNKE